MTTNPNPNTPTYTVFVWAIDDVEWSTFDTFDEAMDYAAEWRDDITRENAEGETFGRVLTAEAHVTIVLTDGYTPEYANDDDDAYDAWVDTLSGIVYTPEHPHRLYHRTYDIDTGWTTE